MFLGAWPFFAIILAKGLNNNLFHRYEKIITTIVFIDLFLVLSPSFRATLINNRPAFHFSQEKNFVHSNEVKKFSNGPSSLYHLERNQGALDCYQEYSPSLLTHALPGPIFPSSINLVFFSPNKFIISTNIPTPFTMNFNYSKNFYCPKNTCHIQESSDHRLTIFPHREEIEIEYSSPLFFEGMMLMIFGFLISLFILYTY